MQWSVILNNVICLFSELGFKCHSSRKNLNFILQYTKCKNDCVFSVKIKSCENYGISFIYFVFGVCELDRPLFENIFRMPYTSGISKYWCNQHIRRLLSYPWSTQSFWSKLYIGVFFSSKSAPLHLQSSLKFGYVNRNTI